jgi:hypothetical protein
MALTPIKENGAADLGTSRAASAALMPSPRAHPTGTPPAIGTADADLSTVID